MSLRFAVADYAAPHAHHLSIPFGILPRIRQVIVSHTVNSAVANTAKLDSPNQASIWEPDTPAVFHASECRLEENGVPL